MATIEIQFDANALHGAPTNGAPLALLDGANVDTFVRSFDDSTEEFAHGKFCLPDDLGASGTVTFSVAVMAKTAAAAKNVEHRFGHAASSDGEDFDVSYTNEDSGNRVINATQNNISIHTWTETVSNLGWAAGDLILFRYSRITPSAANLPGDMYLFHLTIKIPV
jgi:hypothetical protein